MVRLMLNRDISINEIIENYPTIRKFLLLNDVDCMNCSVKTCLLKDILEYHNFSKEDQNKMYHIIDLLADNKPVELKKFVASKKTSNYSLIIETLINEHKYIKDLIYILKYISTKNNFLEKYHDDLNKITLYLSEFADSFHHQKEENLLFSLFRNKEIVETMYEEHEIGRSLRLGIVKAKSNEEAKDYIEQFCNMLDNHIHKEDHVLFPYLDRNLTKDNIISLNNKLKKYDQDLEQEVVKYIQYFNSKEFKM